MKTQDSNEVSIFSNIPEVTQQPSFSDKVEKTSAPIIKKKCVYLIMCGQDNSEYYTSEVPVISGDDMTLYNPVKKGVLREAVLEDFVEEYYCDHCEDEMVFTISNGILMKRHFEDDLPWLNRAISDAQIVIKDKVIMKYNQIVPTLMNNIKNLQVKTEQMQQQQQDRQQQRQQRNQQRQQNQDDDLLDL